MTCFGGDLRSQSASILLLLRHIYIQYKNILPNPGIKGRHHTLSTRQESSRDEKTGATSKERAKRARGGGAGEREERREGGREKDHSAGMKSRTPN